MPTQKQEKVDQMSTDFYIPSVSAASHLIVKAYQSNDYAMLTRIRAYLQNKKVAQTISGNPVAFHNATVNLSRIDFDDYAYMMAEIGLQRNPRDTDLLGDILQYGMSCRPREVLRKWYEDLLKIDWRFWTWRSYQFSFDYLMDCLPNAKDPEELAKTEDEIMRLIEEFKKHFAFMKDRSDCEKAYMMEYEYYISKGMEDEAEQALKDATERLRNKCAQCALKLADRRFEMGDYSGTIKYAGMATKIKEDQHSISLGYAYYILAMSQEWTAREDNALAQEERIREIYASYNSALTYMSADRMNLIKSIKDSVKVLEFETGFPSHIGLGDHDDNSEADMDMLRRLLMAAQENED